MFNGERVRIFYDRGYSDSFEVVIGTVVQEGLTSSCPWALLKDASVWYGTGCQVKDTPPKEVHATLFIGFSGYVKVSPEPAA